MASALEAKVNSSSQEMCQYRILLSLLLDLLLSFCCNASSNPREGVRVSFSGKTLGHRKTIKCI
jgi:hypothetical protein